MPELWELCNPKSRATLGYLFMKENGHYPDWDPRSGKTLELQQQDYSMVLNNTEMEDSELDRFMRQAPHSLRHIA